MPEYNAHPECFWKSGWTQKGAEVGEFEARQLLEAKPKQKDDLEGRVSCFNSKITFLL
jgi:hypothetical protein